MQIKVETGDADQIESVRRAKLTGNLEEAIRALLRVHTQSDTDGTVTVLWGALPNDDAKSYSLYRQAWTEVAEALRRGEFREASVKKAAAE